MGSRVSAHTPGPWVMEPAAQQKPRMPIKVAHAVIRAGGTRLADVRLAVDARVMVAAPELLEALKAASEDLHRVLPASARLSWYRDVIAKAEGRAVLVQGNDI